MRGRAQRLGTQKVAGNLLHMSGYRGLNITQTEGWMHMIIDTRLSVPAQLQCLVPERESLGMSLGSKYCFVASFLTPALVACSTNLQKHYQDWTVDAKTTQCWLFSPINCWMLFFQRSKLSRLTWRHCTCYQVFLALVLQKLRSGGQGTTISLLRWINHHISKGSQGCSQNVLANERKERS